MEEVDEGAYTAVGIAIAGAGYGSCLLRICDQETKVQGVISMNASRHLYIRSPNLRRLQ